MISIIIPTYNEENGIERLVRYLFFHSNGTVKEIIVTDGGSTDRTIAVAKAAGASAVLSPLKGRAAQMNFGAAMASGDILYFIHADTFPPPSFGADIQQALLHRHAFGRYRTRFDSNKWILSVNAFFTRFDLFICYGGDQTLFMTRALFDAIEGFNPAMRIMEDYDIVVKAKVIACYKIIPKTALVSARKYDKNGWFKVLKANYIIVQMFNKGASQEAMMVRYNALLD